MTAICLFAAMHSAGDGLFACLSVQDCLLVCLGGVALLILHNDLKDFELNLLYTVFGLDQ